MFSVHKKTSDVLAASSSIRSTESTDFLYYKAPSKLKTYGFAIVIIVGVGLLITGGVGTAAHLGAISNLNQVQAIIMMSGGCAGGTILFIVGAVGTAKNRRDETWRDRALERRPVKTEIQDIIANNQDLIGKTNTQNGLVYGPDAWPILGVEVADENISPKPEGIPWDEDDPYFKEPYRKNYALLYIPEKIIFNGEEIDLTTGTLLKISSSLFAYCDRPGKTFEDQDKTHCGWILVSKKVIPDTLNTSINCHINKRVGMFRMPNILEAVAAYLIISLFTNQPLYGFEEATSCYDNGSYARIGFHHNGFHLTLAQGRGLGCAPVRTCDGSKFENENPDFQCSHQERYEF